MWMQVLVGFGLLLKTHGYSNGNFPESCGSLLPQHLGASGELPPLDTEPPFIIRYEQDRNAGDPVTVFLESTGSAKFKGFMLDAQEVSGEVLSDGKFTLLEPSSSQLLTCFGQQGSAVSHRYNHQKSQIKVNWTWSGEERDILLRATFLQEYDMFWNPIPVVVTRPPTTTNPTVMEPTTETDMTMPTTPDQTAPVLNKTTELSSKEGGISLMCVDSVVEQVKKEVFKISTFSFGSKLFSCHLGKGVMILCSLLSLASNIISLVLFLVFDSELCLVALVSVGIALSLFELVFVSLPVGPSDERKEKYDRNLEGFFAIHHLYTTAVIFVGVVLVDDDRGQNWRESWIIMIITFFTVWILLNQVSHLILSIKKRTILGTIKEKSKSRKSNRKECPSTTEVVLLFLSIISNVVTVSFVIVIIALLYS